MKTISITGSSGFVGTNLQTFFKSKGFNVIDIKRDELKDINKLTKIIENSNVVINLAGANIINRWTNSYKKLLYSSRVETTNSIVKAMKRAEKKPELFISTSAVGIYKNKSCYDEENFELENDFLANLCKDWESSALKANDLGIRTTIFRFGIVMGKGGALKKMLTPFRLGLGGAIGDGSQDFSFIHIDDLLNAYEFVVNNKKISGSINLTAPTPSSNLGLTLALGKSLNRPTILPVPEFILNLIFSEGAKVLTDGQCVKPKTLLDNGFEFKYKTIEETIDNLVK